MAGTLFMIPNTLGDSKVEGVIPQQVLSMLKTIKYYIVEDIRTTRRFLKKVDKSINIDEITFYELNKRTTPEERGYYLKAAEEGYDIGVISEAGCPGVADPGADVVADAHQKNIKVVPLVGPSSILLSLMASGMNGQSFAFRGYLPVKKNDRIKELKRLEQLSFREKQTQVFIETPYRNNHMMQDILDSCSSKTRVCVACDITLDTEFIKTQTVNRWKKKVPDLHKRPVVFLIMS